MPWCVAKLLTAGVRAYRESARSAVLIDCRAHQHCFHVALVLGLYWLNHNCGISLQTTTPRLRIF